MESKSDTSTLPDSLAELKIRTTPNLSAELVANGLARNVAMGIAIVSAFFLDAIGFSQEFKWAVFLFFLGLLALYIFGFLRWPEGFETSFFKGYVDVSEYGLFLPETSRYASSVFIHYSDITRITKRYKNGYRSANICDLDIEVKHYYIAGDQKDKPSGNSKLFKIRHLPDVAETFRCIEVLTGCSIETYEHSDSQSGTL